MEHCLTRIPDPRIGGQNRSYGERHSIYRSNLPVQLPERCWPRSFVCCRLGIE